MVSPFYTDWDSQAFKNYLENSIYLSMKNKTFFYRYENEIVFSTSFESLSIVYIRRTNCGLDPIVRNEVLEILQSELLDEHKTLFISTHIISDLEKIRLSCTYKRWRSYYARFRHQLQEQYSIVQGDNQDLDEELNRLFLYKEVKSTGFVGFTKQAQVFKELFGKS